MDNDNKNGANDTIGDVQKSIRKIAQKIGWVLSAVLSVLIIFIISPIAIVITVATENSVPVSLLVIAAVIAAVWVGTGAVCRVIANKIYGALGVQIVEEAVQAAVGQIGRVLALILTAVWAGIIGILSLVFWSLLPLMILLPLVGLTWVIMLILAKTITGRVTKMIINTAAGAIIEQEKLLAYPQA